MKLNKFKDYSVFFWLILIAILSIFISSIYKKNQQAFFGWCADHVMITQEPVLYDIPIRDDLILLFCF